MAQDESALDEDLGEATVVYEDPDGETIEQSVPNEHVAYFQDHWIVKTGTDERGRDTIRRIPAQRVFYVERSVQEFEEEVKTIKDRVESVADELRTLLPTGGRGRKKPREQESMESQEEVHHIDVDSGEPIDEGDGGSDDVDESAGDDER